ncbi:hypothetical protein EG68_10397 [Paragonimus skrjabini miyazakii]|uniref:Uncharacterized protein n=1 Tax=Paragonimus skrjabini miyazakii TaxID=59628 RepID=A0A8S9YS48_9TREM|nr:hypothetical protein EG68_10397 [Paragonimus skrjabini miyazakii]
MVNDNATLYGTHNERYTSEHMHRIICATASSMANIYKSAQNDSLRKCVMRLTEVSWFLSVNNTEYHFNRSRKEDRKSTEEVMAVFVRCEPQEKNVKQGIANNGSPP